MALVLAAAMACAVLAAPAAAADDGAVLFDPAAVHEIDFDLTEAARAAIDADPGEYAEAGITVEIGDQTHELERVGLRLRGSSSFRTMDGKASFKVKFNEFVKGQKLLGLKKLTLNNMVQDESMIHEALAYRLFRAVGVAAPRTGYAFVRVNDDEYGVYLNVEAPDDVSLPRWFDSTEHLYEGGYGLDVRAEHVEFFQPDEGDGDDRTDLEAFAAALANGSLPFSQRLEGIADLEQMTAMWAVERYLAHWDGYTGNPEVVYEADQAPPNNYYLHSDASGVFTMLPWGTDQTFLRDWFVHAPNPDGPQPYLVFDAPSGLLLDGCLADAACTELYLDALGSLPEIVEALGLDAQAGELATELAPWQADDPRREYSLEQIAEAVDATRAFIRSRPGDLFDDDYWTGDSPFEPTPEDPDVPVEPIDPVEPVDPGPAPAEPTRPGDPAAPGAQPDLTAPQTTLVDGPDPLVNSKHRRAIVRFRFRSSERGSTFECRLDERRWAACDSPRRLLVDGGDHVFRMRAIDPAGNADPTPARRRWSVAAFG
jgi:hypothetical protein